MNVIIQTANSLWSGISSTFTSTRDAARQRALLAEYRLLSRLPFLHHDALDLMKQIENKEENIDVVKQEIKDTVAGSNAYAKVTQIRLDDSAGDDSPYINTFIMDNDGNKDFKSPAEHTLVLTHGFGAALGFWFKNLHELSTIEGVRVYAIDWLGMGLSSRVNIPQKLDKLKEEEDIESVENYFIDSFEKWRIKCGIEKFTLVSHSLGGYFSAIYAIKYPQNLDRLVLVSPAGIPQGDFGQVIKRENLTFYQRWLLDTFVRLWETGYTPQGAVRSMGYFGQKALKNYTTRRFPSLSQQDSEDLYEYLSAITALEGAGEYALGRLLKPGAYAKRPLADRLEQLKMETVFIYGEKDWMDPTIPLCLIQQGKMHHPKSRVKVVQNAGHQLFIDNPEEFNEILKSIVLNK